MLTLLTVKHCASPAVVLRTLRSLELVLTVIPEGHSYLCVGVPARTERAAVIVASHRGLHGPSPHSWLVRQHSHCSTVSHSAFSSSATRARRSSFSSKVSTAMHCASTIICLLTSAGGARHAASVRVVFLPFASNHLLAASRLHRGHWENTPPAHSNHP